MVTLNGFLSQAPGEPPRMSERQKQVLLLGVSAVLEATYQDSVATGILEKINDALDVMPDSTACVCCDYYNEGVCGRCDEKIPVKVLPKGCDSFEDQSARLL